MFASGLRIRTKCHLCDSDHAMWVINGLVQIFHYCWSSKRVQTPPIVSSPVFCTHCSLRFLFFLMTRTEPDVVFCCSNSTTGASKFSMLCFQRCFSAHRACTEWLLKLPYFSCQLKPSWSIHLWPLSEIRHFCLQNWILFCSTLCTLWLLCMKIPQDLQTRLCVPKTMPRSKSLGYFLILNFDANITWGFWPLFAWLVLCIVPLPRDWLIR